MRLLHLAAASVNTTPMDWEGNARVIAGAIAEARARGAELVCLPELCISGYGCEDAFHSAALRRRAWRTLESLLPETRGLVVSLGLPVMHRNALFNAACVAVDGRIAGLVAKRHLAGDGLHYEPRWFKPWPEGIRAELDADDAVPGAAGTPIGDLHFEIGGIRIGFEICEDAWVAARPGAGLAARGVDVILNPSASHFAFGKQAVRRRLVLEGARAFGLTYVYTNLLGNEAGRAIYDGGPMIASAGELIAVGRRFSFSPIEVVDAVIDVDATRASRARTASFQPSLERDPLCVSVDHRFAVGAPVRTADGTAPRAVPAEAWERSPHVEREEFTRAVALALFDYARKSGSRGFVISLSGGVDSSATACLVSMMVRLACRELGAEGFRRAFPHGALEGSAVGEAESGRGLEAASEADPVPGFVHAFLTTIYQSTVNSSKTTRDAAAAVARAIHARHVEWDVSDLVDRYVALAEAAEGRRLDWSRDDLALQNIQARVRAPGAWLVANLRGALLLTTSNRSEAAVGYATMDGDTSGGLAPLGGIDKAFLREWLVWLEREGPADLGPIPALRAVNEQAPTAELRPPDRRQTDEADLMPYDVLEAIEDAAIGAGQSPQEALWRLRARFPHHDDEALRRWVARFYTLWARNQWKRERLAPCFHVDDKNLDPRTWCRFPILSGGFRQELAEMEADQMGSGETVGPDTGTRRPQAPGREAAGSPRRREDERDSPPPTKQAARGTRHRA